MATKTIERSYPGKSAAEIYAAVEKVIGRLGDKFGLKCSYDAGTRRITAQGPLGISGECRIQDGKAVLDLSHGLAGGMVVGQVKSTVEKELDRLFA